MPWNREQHHHRHLDAERRHPDGGEPVGAIEQFGLDESTRFGPCRCRVGSGHRGEVDDGVEVGRWTVAGEGHDVANERDGVTGDLASGPVLAR